VTGTKEPGNVDVMQAPMPKSRSKERDLGTEETWDVMDSALSDLADDFGPNKLIGNPLFMQKTNSFAVTASTSQSGSYHANLQALADMPDEELPTPPPLALDIRVPPLPESTPQDTTETLVRLPMKQTTKRFQTQREEPQTPTLAPETPVGESPPSDVLLTVRALTLTKNFPSEVLCAATWGEKYLFGTDNGLYQLDTEGAREKPPLPFWTCHFFSPSLFFFFFFHS